MCGRKSGNLLSIGRVRGFPAYQGYKARKRLKERLLVGRKRTKCAKFRGSPRFQAMHNIKTEEEKNSLRTSDTR